MQIGILGGTFDPPHLGHLIMAVQIKERMGFDELWLMPVSTHAFDKSLSATHDRMEMTKLAEQNGIIASDYEIKKGGISSTYHTMKSLREENPQHHFYFCMGSDLLEDFHKWNDWQELVEENNIVIYPRGCELENLCQMTTRVMGAERMSKITIIEGPDVIVTNISSTVVKQTIKQEKTISHIVPEQIISYIKQHKLYR